MSLMAGAEVLVMVDEPAAAAALNRALKAGGYLVRTGAPTPGSNERAALVFIEIGGEPDSVAGSSRERSSSPCPFSTVWRRGAWIWERGESLSTRWRGTAPSGARVRTGSSRERSDGAAGSSRERSERALALLRKMRTDGRGSGRIIVAIARRSQADDETAALAAGADEVWALPLDRRVLGHRLAALERRWSELRVLTVANRELRERERLLQTIIDAVPHRMFIKDRQRRYILVNRALAQAVGRPPQEMIGRTVHELSYFTPELLRVIDAADERVLNDGLATETVEERVTDPDGPPQVFHVLKIPVTAESGAVIAAAGISQDITNRKRSEEALRASQRLLQTLVDTLPMYVSVKDRNLRYTLVNRLVRESQDPGSGDPVNRTFDEVGHHSDERRAWVRQADRRVLETGQAQRIGELRTSRRQGVESWERVVKLPLRNEAGEIAGIITVGEDITELKRAETERLRLERHFQHAQKLESLGVLAGGIAHDFNNLLTGILGNAELALVQLDPGHPASAPIADVRTASLRAAALVRQMLDYAGKGRRSTGLFRIDDCVQEMVHLLRASIPSTIDVAFDLAPGLPSIEGDAAQIQQVAMNLITNAAEAIGSGPGTVTVATGVETLTPDTQAHWRLNPHVPPGEYVYLEVRDTGSGMTEDVRARIFEPFFTTKFTGRGLGLAAVLGIVRTHGGAIGIETAPGRGTTFRVWLPASALPGEAAPSQADSAVPRSFTGRVLLVDDDPMVRDVLRRQLEVLGFTVAVASNGKEALDRFGDRLADLAVAVLDATMPVMGGKETLRELKRRRPSLPVILCSGHDEQSAQSGGVLADGYLNKPVPMDTLRETLQMTMRSGAAPT
jgi:two-component system, cell cycle sensor histidine kinase and response regulator CckA